MKTRSKTFTVIVGTIFAIAVLLTLALASAQQAQQVAIGKAQLIKQRAQLAQATKRLQSAVEPVAAPLRNLNEEQRASVVALFYLTSSLRVANTAHAQSPQESVTQFGHALGTVSPQLTPIGEPRAVGNPCFGESISCASALAGCEKKGVNEQDCKESYVPCGQQVACAMREIEIMRGKVNDLFGHLTPPKPDPWPPGPGLLSERKIK